MAITKVTEKEVAFSKTLDANGWTVYDYGSWKEYRVRRTVNQSVNTATVIGLSSQALPSGMATLGSNFLTGNFSLSGNAYALDWNFEMTSTSPTINITGRSNTGAAVTFTGYIDMTIVSA